MQTHRSGASALLCSCWAHKAVPSSLLSPVMHVVPAGHKLRSVGKNSLSNDRVCTLTPVHTPFTPIPPALILTWLLALTTKGSGVIPAGLTSTVAVAGGTAPGIVLTLHAAKPSSYPCHQTQPQSTTRSTLCVCFVCLGATPGGARGLHLALHIGIILREVQGTGCGAGSRTRACYTQGKFSISAPGVNR